jgi:hypothetical protein
MCDSRLTPVNNRCLKWIIRLLAIILIVNANANDSHVDYHIHFGVDDYNDWGNKHVSAVLTVGGTGIIRVRLRGIINDQTVSCPNV